MPTSKDEESKKKNPDKIEVVLDDELEDEMPNISKLLDLPCTPITKDSGPYLPSSMLPDTPLSANQPTEP